MGRQAEHVWVSLASSSFGHEHGWQYLAVEEILAKPLTNSTDPTVMTVVYAFLAVIVPKFADIAVVQGSLLVTMSAIPCRRLSMSAQHT